MARRRVGGRAPRPQAPRHPDRLRAPPPPPTRPTPRSQWRWRRRRVARGRPLDGSSHRRYMCERRSSRRLGREFRQRCPPPRSIRTGRARHHARTVMPSVTRRPLPRWSRGAQWSRHAPKPWPRPWPRRPPQAGARRRRMWTEAPARGSMRTRSCSRRRFGSRRPRRLTMRVPRASACLGAVTARPRTRVRVRWRRAARAARTAPVPTARRRARRPPPPRQLRLRCSADCGSSDCSRCARCACASCITSTLARRACATRPLTRRSCRLPPLRHRRSRCAAPRLALGCASRASMATGRRRTRSRRASSGMTSSSRPSRTCRRQIRRRAACIGEGQRAPSGAPSKRRALRAVLVERVELRRPS